MGKNIVIKAFGVAKSSVYYKSKEYPKDTKRKKKPTPPEVKSAIFAITERKATYGVPRVKALLKRDHGIEISKYMVHRIMKEEGLLIKKNRPLGASRPHTGQISVAKPNTRWASDITTIKCWNGEKVKVAIVLDCCDRSIISWISGKHIQACDIELMVQDALIKLFRKAEAPLSSFIQFLHDNGPEFIERKLGRQLKKWNIENCNTPTYSPQSNGMYESFMGTLKRDYVY
ncbi:DDE-type integrase/transposase/recombinase [Persicobacter diffluens]|uniref:Integrase n=1 Tax=Persicobacter diffluens TaxID=981 RepID=A0AAN4W5V0_9BACT|nr:integrase [Persicobacter diffluens]